MSPLTVFLGNYNEYQDMPGDESPVLNVMFETLMNYGPDPLTYYNDNVRDISALGRHFKVPKSWQKKLDERLEDYLASFMDDVPRYTSSNTQSVRNRSSGQEFGQALKKEKEKFCQDPADYIEFRVADGAVVYKIPRILAAYHSPVIQAQTRHINMLNPSTFTIVGKTEKVTQLFVRFFEVDKADEFALPVDLTVDDIVSLMELISEYQFEWGAAVIQVKVVPTMESTDTLLETCERYGGESNWPILMAACKREAGHKRAKKTTSS